MELLICYGFVLETKVIYLLVPLALFVCYQGRLLTRESFVRSLIHDSDIRTVYVVAKCVTPSSSVALLMTPRDTSRSIHSHTIQLRQLFVVTGKTLIYLG